MSQHGKDLVTPPVADHVRLVLEAAERDRKLGILPLPTRIVLTTIGAWQVPRYMRRLRAS